jgi:hypothetical protein
MAAEGTAAEDMEAVTPAASMAAAAFMVADIFTAAADILPAPISEAERSPLMAGEASIRSGPLRSVRAMFEVR